MTEDALQLLLENADYADLLHAYARARTETAPDADADAEGAGWASRRGEVPGIDDVCLAPMHGKLIAYGLLNFQLMSRTAGVVYRVSPEGRDVLRRFEASVASAPAVEASTDLPEDEYPAEAAA